MDDRLGLHSSSGKQVAFCGAIASAHLAGLLAETVIEQRYANTTTENLEITYTFALPIDAVLLGFEVQLGERRLIGKVVPRADAEEKYEAAVESGNSAFRLTLLRAGLYGASLGNLMAGEAAVLRLRYAEPLRQVSGRLRYRLPTTVAPRYGNSQDLHAWFEPQSDMQSRFGFEATIQLEGELSKARFVCPTHRLACTAGIDRLTFTLADAQMDRDFVLDLEPQGREAMAVAARSSDTTEKVIVMASVIPSERSVIQVSREVVVVIDCSGSMAGDSIAHAKAGVLRALASLRPTDRFGLIRFGSEVQIFESRILQADQMTLQRAQKWVDETDATLGGTELARALNVAMRLPSESREQVGRDVLLLTDGETWDVDEVIEYATDSNVRIFTVGIGAAVAEDTVRLLADETDGACEMVTPDEDMSARIAAHFARMRQLPISAIEIDWGVTPDWEVRPHQALFAGDAFVAYAALPSEPHAMQTVLHYADGTEQSWTTSLAPAVSLKDAVVRCAAAARMQVLSSSARCDWAVQHQLVSSETDYIVTLERAANERAKNLPCLQQTPQMLAAGWGGTGTVLSATRGAASFACASGFADFDLDDEVPSHQSSVLRNAQRVLRDNVITTVGDVIRRTESAVSAVTQALSQSDATLLSQVVLHCEGDPSRLPSTIDELIVLGLDPALTQVLKDLIARLSAKEAEVVRAFLIILAKEAAPGTDESRLLVFLSNGIPTSEFLYAVEHAFNKARGLNGSMRQIRNVARRIVDTPFDVLHRISR